MSSNHNQHTDCCHPNPQNKVDKLGLIAASIVVAAYLATAFGMGRSVPYWQPFGEAIYSVVHQVWWGILLGIFLVGIVGLVPQALIIRILGEKKGLKGLIRATIAGLLFDMCNHGILMLAMKFYKQGVRTPQVMAFLIASPWNSLSVTVILWSLVGLGWTLAFIALSLVIALVSGLLFELLETKEIIPENPNTPKQLPAVKWQIPKTAIAWKNHWWNSLKEGWIVIKWTIVGIVIAALIQAFVPLHHYQAYFGPTLLGLFATLFFATIIEVCSEGTVPIAADLLTRATAPGNAFTFMMAGVATDYTEIMALKDTTKSWKITLALPLVTIPQTLLLGYILNAFAG